MIETKVAKSVFDCNDLTTVASETKTYEKRARASIAIYAAILAFFILFRKSISAEEVKDGYLLFHKYLSSQ